MAGDTLYVDFELPPVAVALAPITVKARQNRLRIGGQFNPKVYRSALDVLVDRRRDMLGDPSQCPLPDPVLGGRGRDSVVELKLTDRISFGNDSRSWREINKRPWLDSLGFRRMGCGLALRAGGLRER